MKTCPECSTSYPPSRVLCLHCNEILEEKHYLRLVWATFIVALAFHFILGRLDYPGTGFISESFKTEVFLLIYSVLFWKLFQKWKNPDRRVMYELASLYSDRLGRLLILGLLLALFYLFIVPPDPVPARPTNPPDALILFNKARYWTVVCLGTAYIAIVLFQQKLALFNFKLPNSLMDREIQNAQKDIQKQNESLNAS